MLYGEVFKDNYILSYYVLKIYTNRDGAEQLIVRTEKNNDPSAFAEFRLPSKNCFKSYGFSEDELMEMQKYLLHNEPLIWEDAREAFSNAQVPA